MIRVAFVILHYLSLEDTRECVKSIFKLQNNESHIDIVIVDNNSYNDSWDSICKEYRNRENIYLLRTSENYGFAIGNNIGYQYARNSLADDFIVILNSDTVITDSGFLRKLYMQYNKEKFHVLGPDLITVKDKVHQNPLVLTFDKTSLFFQLINSIFFYVVEAIWLNEIRIKIKSRIKKSSEVLFDEKKIDCNVQYNVPIHGACVIFSPLFIEKFNVAFYTETFLYMEENILFYLCEHFDLKTCYVPKMEIYHKEDASTDILMRNRNRKKRLFTFRNQIKSCASFISLINKNYTIETYNQLTDNKMKKVNYMEE